MSNEFENNNDGGENNQNPYYQDYGGPSQGSGQQDYSKSVSERTAGLQQSISERTAGLQQSISERTAGLWQPISERTAESTVIHIRTDSKRTAVTTHMEMFR